MYESRARAERKRSPPRYYPSPLFGVIYSTAPRKKRIHAFTLSLLSPRARNRQPLCARKRTRSTPHFVPLVLSSVKGEGKFPPADIHILGINAVVIPFRDVA